jgi:hypothetical protein
MVYVVWMRMDSCDKLGCHSYNEPWMFSQSLNNPFNHVLVTKDLMQVYLDISAIGMLFLGAALACYGKQLLF